MPKMTAILTLRGKMDELLLLHGLPAPKMPYIVAMLYLRGKIGKMLTLRGLSAPNLPILIFFAATLWTLSLAYDAKWTKSSSYADSRPKFRLAPPSSTDPFTI